MKTSPISSDPRSQRSRQQIVDALHRQAREGNLTSISSLSIAAGVTRATFYNHFDTIEQASWYAVLDSFDKLLVRAFREREAGAAFDDAAITNLGEIVELLRTEAQLIQLADAYDNGSELRGVAEIFRVQNRIVWTDSGSESATAEIEVTYVAAGLYAVLSMGARGTDHPMEIARLAHSLLPDWMRRPDPEDSSG